MTGAAGPSQTLVLGIGNLLLGDEGVGVEVARRLLEAGPPPGADVLDGGTGGFHLLELFGRYGRIIIVDATLGGPRRGAVEVLRPRYARDFPPSLTAHDIGLKDMIEAALLLGHSPEILLVTISIGDAGEARLGLSPEVAAAAREAEGTVRELVGRLP